MRLGIKDPNIMDTGSRRNRREGGFTLLEVIMAISILTIGILAVASMQISAIRGNAFSRDVTESTDRIQDRMEKLFTLSFTNNNLSDRTGDGVNGLNDEGANADFSDVSDPKYTIYWNVANNVPITNVRTIRVIVVWQDRSIQKRRSFDFLRTEI